jgi:hypothetical protein
MFLAAGKFQREWNSTMISILSPTALRIFSNGERASLSCAAEMKRPWFSIATGSKGQIFIAPIPLSRRLSASASARVMNASRSSNGPPASPRFQFETGLMFVERTYL